MNIGPCSGHTQSRSLRLAQIGSNSTVLVRLASSPSSSWRWLKPAPGALASVMNRSTASSRKRKRARGPEPRRTACRSSARSRTIRLQRRGSPATSFAVSNPTEAAPVAQGPTRPPRRGLRGRGDRGGCTAHALDLLSLQLPTFPGRHARRYEPLDAQPILWRRPDGEGFDPGLVEPATAAFARVGLDEAAAAEASATAWPARNLSQLAAARSLTLCEHVAPRRHLWRRWRSPRALLRGRAAIRPPAILECQSLHQACRPSFARQFRWKASSGRSSRLQRGQRFMPVAPAVAFVIRDRPADLVISRMRVRGSVRSGALIAADGGPGRPPWRSLSSSPSRRLRLARSSEHSA